ncbi:lipid A export permease/ATP-binding protein MsbA [Rhodoferax saidenbachensis]|uniref:Subfamily B ATP-binding cassette protein MsbA n=1 Tax=Rhodoferax saidenbachensis TaxID=1484693 RepID=A0ABU1ZIA4_9BURK|nr:lipid A export permease/ATP-binding protein MsbA [Rhodoferax saidenbachensis]MDR7305269.1 subfamily B ATP-binding cassette protein MsbA [Rhodoferax saidenbachensis]
MTKADRALYLRLLGFLRPNWKAFSIAVLCMVFTAATEPVFPAIMKHLLDSGFRASDARMVWLIPASIVLLFLARGVLSFVTNYLMTWVSTRLVVDLRRTMFDKLVGAPTQIFHTQPASQWIARLLYDVDNINQAATNVLVTAVRESLTAVALLSYLVYLDWKLTLITLTVGPVIAILIQSFGRRIRKASRASLESLRAVAHTVEETTAANKVIKIYGGQAQQKERFHAVTENFRRSMMKEAVPASALTPITHMTASVAIAFIIYMALSRAMGQAGDTAGGFVSFITAMLLLISPIKQLTTISPILQRGLAACESVFGVLDAPVEADAGQARLPECKGEIRFENVSFRYPGSDKLALDKINLQVQPGQTIALVGASGGGKSTLAALIPRFYAPDSGRITVDGVDIATLALTNLREHIALVSQDIVLLNDTIRANIAFGQSRGADETKVREAAIAAHAWEFISQLPQGLDTLTGENGATLSGGQRQRIAIARALLKDAPVLILDEATSALDTESERVVQDALATLMRNRTTLVIAHRLSTIERADLILVLDQGRIVESGDHASLIQRNGYYANLQRLQT